MSRIFCFVFTPLNVESLINYHSLHGTLINALIMDAYKVGEKYKREEMSWNEFESSKKLSELVYNGDFRCCLVRLSIFSSHFCLSPW